MRRNWPVLAGLLPLLAGGCSPDPIPAIDLDLSASCLQARITTVEENVLSDGFTVHAVAMDAPGANDGWVLVTVDESGLAEPHRLVRLRDSSVQVVLYGVDSASELELLAGPVAGEAWVLERRPEAMHAMRLEAGTSPGVHGVNRNLHDFPIPGTESWTRRLVFVGGLAHLAAIDPTTEDDGLRLFVGRFGSDLDLDLSTSWELRFADPCDPDLAEEEFIACEANKASLSYADVAMVAASNDPRAPQARLAVTRTRLRDGIEDGDELVVIGLARGSGGMPTGFLRDLAVQHRPPYSMAVDDFAAYLGHDSPWSTMVWRLDDFTKQPKFLGGNESLSPTGTRLVQLDGDVALGRTEGGDFVFTKLFADAPNLSQVTIVPHDEGARFTEFSGAGPGHMLLTRETGAPRLIRAECDARDTGAEFPEPIPSGA